MNKATAGELLCVDSGKYSDYTVMGFFVVLRDFEPHTELATYLGENPQENEFFDEDQFLAFLLKKGLLLEINYGRLHLTDYSEPETFSFTPSK